MEHNNANVVLLVHTIIFFFLFFFTAHFIFLINGLMMDGWLVSRRSFPTNYDKRVN